MGLGYDGNVPDIRHAIPQNAGLRQFQHGNPSMRGNAPEAPSTDDILNRLREFFGVRTDLELAERMEVGRSAPSNWRSRKSKPFDLIAAIAVKHHVSLDWLIFGEPLPCPGTAPEVGDRSPEAARIRQFVDFWDKNRPHNEVVWLEHQFRRAIPDHAEWSPAGEG
jgi:hypothetical protein